jgi:uncharacterized protein
VIGRVALRLVAAWLGGSPIRLVALIGGCALATAAWAATTTPAADSAAGSPPAACPPLPTVDSAPARDRGLLWSLARDGRVSYLFGTLHIGRPGWERFGPRTAAALAQTDVLAVEIDPTDPSHAQSLAGAPANSAPPVLPAALAARLQQAFDRACLPAAALAALHPLVQATVLSITEARWLGLVPEASQELLLVTAARRAGRTVAALETVAQQRDALLAAAAAGGEALAPIEEVLTQLERGVTRRALTRLVSAWEQGDLATIERYEDWCECAPADGDRAAMRRLNDERNPALADGIAALHGSGSGGRRVFAAVGALHMTGALALPRLLAERGFRVERVPFGH